LAALAQEWAGRIVVRKIDVDQFDGIWQRFNFRGIPAMIARRSWWPNSNRTSRKP
jgi:thioredoxin-like negative regulator of GroEL